MKYFGGCAMAASLHVRPGVNPTPGRAWRIGDPAIMALERRDPIHLVLGQQEVEHVEVFGHARAIRGARDRNDVALLEEPAQCDLRERAPFAGGDVREHRVAQQPPTAEWAIGGEDQAALAACLRELGLVEMRVILRLQIDQRLGTEPDCFVEHRDIEICNPYMAGEALPLCFGQRADRLAEWDLGVRPMDHEKIDVVDSQIPQALLDRAREIVGAQIFVRYFGGQEDLAARHARGAHALADAALGAVFPGRVDVTIAEPEGGRDDLAAIAQGGGAEADRRQFGAVRG